MNLPNKSYVDHSDSDLESVYKILDERPHGVEVLDFHRA